MCSFRSGSGVDEATAWPHMVPSHSTYLRQVRIAGDAAQPVEHVAAAHLAQAVEQLAGVVEHDARVAALVDQLGNDVAHAAVAVGEDAGVVVVARCPGCAS